MRVWSKSPTLWQRNATATLIVLAALTTLWFTVLRADWSAYRAITVPAHIVPRGQAATVDGVTWRIGAVRYLDRAGSTDLPSGTVLNVVTVERTGGGAGPPCSAILTDGTRRWRAEQLGSYSLRTPSAMSNNCTTPGPVQFTFLVPAGAVPTAVDVTEAGRITVRLQR